MPKLRLEALSDGVFAIVMTLLVIEIKVPEGLHKVGEISQQVSNQELTHELLEMTPLFLAYVLSFAVLLTYWFTHNFLISVLAKNVSRNLMYLNFLFLMIVSLIPFSAHLLGSYYQTQIAVFVYGINILLIGLSLLAMRTYIFRSKKIENTLISNHDLRWGTIRLSLPIIFTIFGLIASFWSTSLSLALFLIPLIIGISPGAIATLDRIFTGYSPKNHPDSD